MPPTIYDLGIDRLSLDDRMRLISEIWDSLAGENPPIPESHRHELDRRLTAADADPSAGRPWKEVHDRLRRQP